MKPEIERLLKNYSNARQSWEAWCFMVNFNCEKRDRGIVEYIDKHELLFLLRYLALKDFHIEAYKILKQSRTNKDNIFKLLEAKAESTPSRKRTVAKCLEELEKQRETIDDICNIRDKFYAHLDEGYKDYLKTGTPLPKILNCLMAIEKSIITVTSKRILQSYLDKIPSRNDLSL